MAADELAASRAMTQGQVREILLQTTEHETAGVTSIHTDAASARNWARPKRRKGKALRQKGLREAWSSKACAARIGCCRPKDPRQKRFFV